MINGEKLKNKLEKIYDNKIAIRKGNSDGKIQYDVGEEKAKEKDIAVYIHEAYRMVVIWDLKGRRNRIKNDYELSHYMNVKYSWKELYDEKTDEIIVYKNFKSGKNTLYEKVIILSFELLDEIIYNLPSYLKFDPMMKNFQKT